MGYAQELNRKLGWFSNFAISFSIISILAGGMTSYWLGLATGGPRVITLGWIIVGFFALLVGMAMGEICSSYPTAGGLYYWSAKLARKNGARWSWYTGWFNLLGQIGVIASVDYALAIFIALLHPHVRRWLQAHRAQHLRDLHPRADRPRIAQHLRRAAGEDPRRHQRVVARRRRRHHRRRPLHLAEQHPGHRGLPSTLRRQGLSGWNGGLVHHDLPVRPRLAARAIHHHRVRRIGARQRGDHRCPHGGTEGDRQGDLRVGDRCLLLELGHDGSASEEGRSRCRRWRHYAGIVFGNAQTRSWSMRRRG